MRVTVDALPAALAAGLKHIYLISGDEPLLSDEAADAVRARARAEGYTERSVFAIDRGFSWDDVRQESRSMSLFADKRLLEVRMPSGKPDQGAEELTRLAEQPPPDILCLILTGKLDRKTSEVDWVRAVQKHGVWVAIDTLAREALPQWLKRRAAALHMELEAEAAELILDCVEGNLLAARQELEKLALLSGGARIDAALVLRSVGDHSRYDVFQLAEAAAAGDAGRALRVLLRLQSEGVAPALVLWALVRELRGLWQARERTRLRSAARGSAWALASRPTERSLARAARLPLGALLAQAAAADRIIKGMQQGEPWIALTALTAALAGALQAAHESGRVA